MKFIALKCPNCGGQLKVEDKEQAICMHCGHDFAIDREQIEIHNHYYNRESPSPNRSSKVPKQPKPKNFIGAMFFFFILAMVLFFAENYDSKVLSKKRNKEEVTMRTIPESEPMKLFVKFLFAQEVTALSTEDFSRIKYLKLAESDESGGWEFSYSFADYNTEGEDFEASVRTVDIYNKDEIHWEDLQCFTGLTKLDLSENSDIKGGWKNEYALNSLINLTSLSVGFNQSASELLEAIAYPEKITRLEIQTRRNADMEALLQFPNLSILHITYFGDELDDFTPLAKLSALHSLEIHCYKNDISWINIIPNLKKLKINNAYQIQDFTPLHGMTQLESLEIYNATNLKSIDFVRNMPKLSELTIEDSAIQTLEALEHKITILNLNLISNLDLSNISALVTLSSLQSITITRSYSNMVVPNLKALEHLEKASISSEFLSAIADNSKIRELNLYVGRDFSAMELIPFQSLESLSFQGNNTLLDSAVLAELPKLVKLSFDDTDVRDLHTIFMLPYVESLWLQDIYAGINPSYFGENGALKELHIIDCENKWRLHVDDWGDFQSIGEFAELLDNFPNLEVLSLPKGKITSIDFVRNMPKLRELNINDNYTSDISPLLQLEDLEELQCQLTPVENLSLLPEGVRVLTN